MALTLKAKLDACRDQLGVHDMPMSDAVGAVAAHLGLSEQLANKPLAKQVDLCYVTLFGKGGEPPMVSAATLTDTNLPVVQGIAVEAAPPAVVRTPAVMTASLWDRKANPNGGPRGDQNVCCVTLLCAPCLALCPMHCLSMWGCAPVVDCCSDLPGKSIPCVPCNPNSKNPLWYCSEPIGWAASFVWAAGFEPCKWREAWEIPEQPRQEDVDEPNLPEAPAIADPPRSWGERRRCVRSSVQPSRSASLTPQRPTAGRVSCTR